MPEIWLLQSDCSMIHVNTDFEACLLVFVVVFCGLTTDTKQFLTKGSAGFHHSHRLKGKESLGMRLGHVAIFEAQNHRRVVTSFLRV